LSGSGISDGKIRKDPPKNIRDEGMGDTSGLRILLAVLLTLTLAQAGQAGDWPMFRHEPAHICTLDSDLSL